MRKKYVNTHKKAACIMFKLSNKEYELAHKKADEAGLSINTYVKNKILQKASLKITNIQ